MARLCADCQSDIGHRHQRAICCDDCAARRRRETAADSRQRKLRREAGDTLCGHCGKPVPDFLVALLGLPVHSDPNCWAGYDRKRRAWLLGVGSYAAVRRWQQASKWILYMTRGSKCGICGDWVTLADCQLDHIWPIARGGGNGYYNLQLAHSRCNARKGNSVRSI